MHTATHPIRPLFLLSLPRSGSTLIQRVLARSPQVATASETWLLMPFLAASPHEALPSRGAWDVLSAEGIADFARELPSGVDSYREAVHDFAMELYSQAADDGATYFLDKTPPYAHFLPELAQTFPEAKFIALWRNPLAVVASIVETFCRGRWDPDRYPLSLYTSLAALVESTQQLPARVWSVRFEDLVSADADAWKGLMEFLDLDFDPASLDEFSRVTLPGRLGDKTGVSRYPELSSEPLTKWKQTIHNPLRRAWCRRYLDWIGPQRLTVMGYDHAELQQDLAATTVGPAGLARDSVHTAESMARRMVRPRSRTPRRADQYSHRTSADGQPTTFQKTEGEAGR